MGNYYAFRRDTNKLVVRGDVVIDLNNEKWQFERAIAPSGPSGCGAVAALAPGMQLCEMSPGYFGLTVKAAENLTGQDYRNIEESPRSAVAAKALENQPVTVTPLSQRHREVYTGHYTAVGDGGFYGVTGVADCGHVYTNVRSDGVVDPVLTGYALPIHHSLCYPCAASRDAGKLDKLGPREKFYGRITEIDGRKYLTRCGEEPLALLVAEETYWAGDVQMYLWTFVRGERTFYGRNTGQNRQLTVRAHQRAQLPVEDRYEGRPIRELIKSDSSVPDWGQLRK